MEQPAPLPLQRSVRQGQRLPSTRLAFLVFLWYSCFWKLNRGFEAGLRPSRQIYDYFEKDLPQAKFCAKFLRHIWDSLRLMHARKLVTSANVSRRVWAPIANVLRKVVADSRSPVKYTGLTLLLNSFPIGQDLYDNKRAEPVHKLNGRDELVVLLNFVKGDPTPTCHKAPRQAEKSQIDFVSRNQHAGITKCPRMFYWLWRTSWCLGFSISH